MAVERQSILKAGETSSREREDRFPADVCLGLTGSPKRLPSKYFYDALGSQLFEAICELPEYYLTRAENEILELHADEIADRFGGSATLGELGSGSSVKTRRLIKAFLERQASLHYQPIDISETILTQSSSSLINDFPGLRVTPHVADYTRGLDMVERDSRERLLLLFLGSNIGNYDASQARELLVGVHDALRPDEALLLGADLKKPRSVLEPAYDDALGVTAAFNRNLLLRINRQLGGEFNLGDFRHRAVYNEEIGRMEMYLVSRRSQSVRIRELGLTVEFAEGEAIHTENSYKYDLGQLRELAVETGYRPEAAWLDSREQFTCQLWMR
jgi:L-histidine Nalpha-methyltransferase